MEELPHGVHLVVESSFDETDWFEESCESISVLLQQCERKYIVSANSSELRNRTSGRPRSRISNSGREVSRTCGLRRAELLSLSRESVQMREARWVIPDLLGKGNRKRTVTVPAGVKARIDAWTAAIGITEGRILRPVTKGREPTRTAILDSKVVWRLAVRYARQTELGKLAPHDLRRTCAKLCRKAGGNLEQIQLLLGRASVQRLRGTWAPNRTWSRP